MPRVRRGRVNKRLKARKRMRKHVLAQLDAGKVHQWVRKHVDISNPQGVRQVFEMIITALVDFREMMEEHDGSD